MIRIKELVGAQLQLDRRNPSATLRYVAWGSDVEADVVAAVLLGSRPVFKGLPRLQADPQEQGGAGVWLVSVRYGLPDALPGANPASPSSSAPPPPAADDPLGPQYGFQWAMQGGRFTQSKETTAVWTVPGFAAPDFGGAIDVQPDGTVNGVDLPSWPDNVTVQSVIDDFTLTYLKGVRGLVGRTNDATFLSCGTGELLYLGGTASPREGGGFTVAHRFAQQERVRYEAGKFAAGFPAFNVDPFAYAWVMYRAETVAGRTVKKPAAVYLERLYDAGDLTQLGLYS